MVKKNIHQTAIISSKAVISDNVIIGPYCVIGDNVKINSNNKLISHVCINGNTVIGKNNIFFPFSSIGLIPQDLKYKGENSKLFIGDNIIF